MTSINDLMFNYYGQCSSCTLVFAEWLKNEVIWKKMCQTPTYWTHYLPHTWCDQWWRSRLAVQVKIKLVKHWKIEYSKFTLCKEKPTWIHTMRKLAIFFKFAFLTSIFLKCAARVRALPYKITFEKWKLTKTK
jgi:hypothetical protein